MKWVLLLYAFYGWAAPIHLDLGSQFPNITETTPLTVPKRSFINATTGYFRIRGQFPLKNTLFFSPSFGFQLPWDHPNVDGGVTRLRNQFNLDFEVKILNRFNIRTGPGLQLTTYFGSGNSIVLQNGTGTATFYAPNGVRPGYCFTWQIAGVFSFYKNWSISMELTSTGLFNSQKRIVNGLLLIGFGV